MYEFEKYRLTYHDQITQFPLHFIGPYVGNELIGWGAVKMTGLQCKESGIKNALLVTTGLKGTGIVEEVQGICKHVGVETTLFKVGQTNPRLADVKKGLEAFKDAEADGILSVGGGSSHDTGKCIRMQMANPDLDLNEVAIMMDPPFSTVVDRIKPVTIPQVSVNSTAGTGAEMTGFGVVTNWEKHEKFSVLATNIAPAWGITDPAVIRTQPRELAAATGIDAFIHGQGGFVSRLQNEASRAVGIRAAKLVAENLPEFTHNRLNDKAAEALAWAQFLGALTYAMGGGSGPIHSHAHAISAVMNMHHGLSNAIMLVPVLKYMYRSAPERYAEMAYYVYGVDTRGMSRITAAEKFVEKTEELRNICGITDEALKLSQYVKQDDLKHMARHATNDFCSEAAPADLGEEDCMEIYQSMM